VGVSGPESTGVRRSGHRQGRRTHLYVFQPAAIPISRTSRARITDRVLFSTISKRLREVCGTAHWSTGGFPRAPNSQSAYPTRRHRSAASWFENRFWARWRLKFIFGSYRRPPRRSGWPTTLPFEFIASKIIARGFDDPRLAGKLAPLGIKSFGARRPSSIRIISRRTNRDKKTSPWPTS